VLGEFDQAFGMLNDGPPMTDREPEKIFALTYKSPTYGPLVESDPNETGQLMSELKWRYNKMRNISSTGAHSPELTRALSDIERQFETVAKTHMAIRARVRDHEAVAAQQETETQSRDIQDRLYSQGPVDSGTGVSYYPPQTSYHHPDSRIHQGQEAWTPQTGVSGRRRREVRGTHSRPRNTGDQTTNTHGILRNTNHGTTTDTKTGGRKTKAQKKAAKRTARKLRKQNTQTSGVSSRPEQPDSRFTATGGYKTDRSRAWTKDPLAVEQMRIMTYRDDLHYDLRSNQQSHQAELNSYNRAWNRHSEIDKILGPNDSNKRLYLPEVWNDFESEMASLEKTMDIHWPNCLSLQSEGNALVSEHQDNESHAHSLLQQFGLPPGSLRGRRSTGGYER
jgi:hypothetical protein